MKKTEISQSHGMQLQRYAQKISVYRLCELNGKNRTVVVLETRKILNIVLSIKLTYGEPNVIIR